MPRRREVPKREILPDPKYHNSEVAKFVNVLMTRGKKSVAERIIYGAMDQIQKRMGKDPVEVFMQALSNVRPMVEVKSRRVGGANYQVPMQVSARRQQSLAFRWIITAARDEKGKPMANRLSKELFDAAKGEGKAMATRETTHKMADANKAFAHFAW